MTAGPCCYFGIKQKASPLDGANEGLLLPPVADRSAGGIDPAVQSSVRDGAALPDLFDQLILADHPVRVPGKVDQQIKDLRLSVNDTGSPSVVPPIRVYREVIKPIQHVTRHDAFPKRIVTESRMKRKIAGKLFSASRNRD